ncbi:DUF6445 family protein [Allosphingosinicella deserti]|uniref:Uncharacterized protein n=1 Tax=Allosphingosinicella deserti TaxID=2116704 RepID=A0A2P7QG11_9SPHN|nr:DUF6445 family protein [Sphingomonas deserti]PSJ36884.1 hypothetical protein C7I55_24560 [Sphingomonas deserti]
MKAQRIFIGTSRSPVVILDGVAGDVPATVDLAAALAPFPRPPRIPYPGVRRIITPADVAAQAYVDRLLDAAAPYIGGGFGVDAFDLIEASFSLITTPPGALAPVQRAPHFDSADPNYLAILHYLSATPNSGTAFYRHRRSGIERVTRATMDSYVAAAKQESLSFDPGYVLGSNAFYERIGAVDAVPDRLIIYQGSLLHSGIVPDGMAFSPDPRAGRLTANLFVRAH